jgi:hypothetical protein
MSHFKFEECDDLCTDEILVALFLVEPGELVLDEFVDIAAFTTTWSTLHAHSQNSLRFKWQILWATKKKLAQEADFKAQVSGFKLGFQ